MKKIMLGISIVCALTFFYGCGDKAKDTLENESRETESKEKEQLSLVGQTYEGKVGAVNVTFQAVSESKYICQILDEHSNGILTHVSEGNYTIKDNRIIMEKLQEFSYERYLKSHPTEAFKIDEEENFPLLDLSIEKDNSIMVMVKEDDEDSKSGGAYFYLTKSDEKIDSIDKRKSTLNLVTDTSSLFLSAEEFAGWVVAHMENSGLTTRNVSEEGELDDGTQLRFVVNVYVEGFEEAPGTTVGVDKNGKVYDDTPRDGKPRMLSYSDGWTEMLKDDIEAGKVVHKETPRDRFIEMEGTWVVVPGDSGIKILPDGNIEILTGPGDPNIQKEVEKVSIDSDNNLVITVDQEDLTIKFIEGNVIDMTKYGKLTKVR